MTSVTYVKRRGELETYFDRTASTAWARLTSDAPVSGVRATVRRGRDEMRATLLSYLPDDLRGKRVLDAGCGEGADLVSLQKRYPDAQMMGIDAAPAMLAAAREQQGSAWSALPCWNLPPSWGCPWPPRPPPKNPSSAPQRPLPKKDL